MWSSGRCEGAREEGGRGRERRACEADSPSPRPLLPDMVTQAPRRISPNRRSIVDRPPPPRLWPILNAAQRTHLRGTILTSSPAHPPPQPVAPYLQSEWLNEVGPSRLAFTRRTPAMHGLGVHSAPVGWQTPKVPALGPPSLRRTASYRFETTCNGRSTNKMKEAQRGMEDPRPPHPCTDELH